MTIHVKLGAVIGLVLVCALAALLLVRNPGAYHLRQFESIKTNFNNFSPSLSDRLRGIHDNQAKWDYHLRKLEELRVVEHAMFVFTNIPYTQESSRRIFRSASSNFPAAVMLTAKYYATNDPAYAVQPYALEVWDFPSNMQAWALFVGANDQLP